MGYHAPDQGARAQGAGRYWPVYRPLLTIRAMTRTHEFTATIQAAGMGGAYVDVPFDVEQVFGRKRVPVVATIDGETYRGSLVRMGSPCHMLLIRKDIRARIGKDVGDDVAVTLREDTEPRTVELPPELAAALERQPDAAAFFRQLSYTHQREYAEWVGEAKREATRRTRVEKTVELLLAGKRTR